MDTISYLPLDKLKQMLGKDEPVTRSDIRQSYFKLKDEIKNSPLRQNLKVGRFIKKLFGEEFSAMEIELFVNKFKSAYEYKDKHFELVSGKNLVKYYKSRYYEFGYGTLNSSCMRYGNCNEFVNFYGLNPDKVKMLILKSTEGDKIKGRALVWFLDEPEGMIFMDRIYYISDYDKQSFITYADSLGWYHKLYNGYSNASQTQIVLKENTITTKLAVQMKKLPYKAYPYADTLNYYNPDDSILSTDNRNPGKSYNITSTRGTYTIR